MKRPALAGLALTLVAGLAVLVPAATRERVVFSSTPSPPPLFVLTLLELAPGNTACTEGIVLATDAERVRLTVSAPGGADAVPFALRLTGAGYGSAGTVRDYVAAGGAVEVGIEPPPRTLPATLCVTNLGTRALALGATAESRTASRTTTAIDGKPSPVDPTIQFLRSERQSFASLLPTLVDRAATFKPGWAAPWLFWTLAGLLVLGLPLGVAAALAVEPRQRDAEPAELETHEPSEHHRRVPAPEPARQGEARDGDGHRHE